MDPFTLVLGALGFVRRHWTVLAFGAVALTATIQTARVDRLKDDVEAAKLAQVNPVTGKAWKVEAQRDAADLKNCRDSVDALETAVGRQNDAVTALQVEGDRLAAAAAKAAQEARSARAVAESRARDLLSLKSAPTCQAREAAIGALVKELTR